MTQIPEYIQILQTQFEAETQAFKKVHRLIDLSEAVIKFHTVVIVSNFMESMTKSLKSEEDVTTARGILSQGLKTPSLGIWAFFTEKIHPLIPKEDLFWEDFPIYFEKTLKKASAEIIPFRNSYAHGSTPDDKECLDDIKKIYPHVEKILKGGVIDRNVLQVGELLKGTKRSHVVTLEKDGRSLVLSPLLVYRESEKIVPSSGVSSRSLRLSKGTTGMGSGLGSDSNTNKRFFYFNDLRNEKKISLLNYEASEHIRDEDLKKAFDEVFPLKSWEKKSVSPFKARIEELTENFKGRREELKQLEGFFREKTKGHFFIWGGPGIGKSTLVARALQLSRASQEKGGATEEESFEVGKDIHFIEYFIRRSTDHSKTTTYLKYMSEEMERIHTMGIPTGNGQDEMAEKYFEKLRTISTHLEEKNKKLVLFIDGLDEADDGFLRYLPMEAQRNILVVLSTRDIPATRDVYLRILENKEEMTLHGLGTDTIRALLYDVVDKYEIQKEYIDGILTKSEGNPLYLRLLLNSLAEKEKRVNDLSALPKGVYDFYQEILNRLQKTGSGTDIYKVLYLLTITKDYLSSDTLSYFTGLDRNKVDIILSDIREILFENPFTTEVEDFQLFHESLREFFKEKYPLQLDEVRERELFPKLRTWKVKYETFQKNKKADPYTIRYILTYIISHFVETTETISEAENLVLSKEFLEIQLDVLQFYTTPLKDAGMVLKQIVSELGGKPCTTRPLSEILPPKKSKDEKFRTTTFVQLVNHTGELSHRASTDIGIAWKWIEEGKVAEALKRLSPIQDKQRLFDCYILALWLLTLQPDGEANRAGLKLVLEDVEKNIPPSESKTVKWHERYTVRFFGEMCKTLLEREQDIEGIFDRGDDEKKRDVIQNWLGYEKVEDEFEQTKFEEEKDFIKRYVSKLISLAHVIESSENRSSLLRSIVESVSKLGDVEMGRSLFPALVEVARGIEDSDYRLSSSLNNIGESVSKLGDVELGRRLFQESIEVARGIEDSYYSSRSLSSIGESVSKLGDVELGRRLFQESIEIARGTEDDYYRSKALSSIGMSLSKLGYVELGRSLLQESIELFLRYNYNDNWLIDELNNIEELGDVELGRNLTSMLIEYTRGFDNTYGSLSKLLSSIGGFVSKLGNVELGHTLLQESLEVARSIESSDYRSEALRNIGGCVGKLDDVELSRSLFPILIDVARGIEDSKYRSKALSSIAESVSKLGNLELGHSLFQESLEVARGIEESRYRSWSLRIIGESVSKLGDVELGRSLFPSLVEVARGIEDSYFHRDTLSSIGESVSKLGDVELGRSLFPILVEISSGNWDWDRIKALCKIGELMSKQGDVVIGRSLFPMLIELARGIEDSNSRSKALSTIGESVINQGDLELGRSLFLESIEVADEIEKPSDPISSLNCIGESVIKLGDMELGRSLFLYSVEIARGIEDSYDRSVVLRSLGESVSKLGDVELGRSLLLESAEVVRGIGNSYFISQALNSIGDSIVKLGDMELGCILLLESVEVSRGIEDSEPLSNSLCSIAESVIKLGNVEFSRNLFPVFVELVRGIEDSKYRSYALSSIGESVSKLGDVELGRRLFLESVELAKNFELSGERRNTLRIVGESISKLGDVELGRSILPELIEVARGINDPDDCSQLLSSIGESICNLRDVELGRSLFPVLLEITRSIEYFRGFMSNALSSIGKSVRQLGDLELSRSLFLEALELVHGIEDSYWRSNTLIIIGRSVSKLGDLELGRILFPLLVELARGIENSVYCSDALGNIGESVSKLGDVEMGRSLLTILVEEVPGIESSKYRSEALSRIGESVSRLGDVELGRSLFPALVEVARGIENSYDRSSSLRSIGESIYKLGESDLSNQLFPQILEMGYQLKVSKERKDVLQSIAKATATFGSTTAYSFFETNHESHPDISEVVKAYTEEYRQINWEESKSADLFPYYIRSFGWIPYEAEFAKRGAYDVVSSLARLGKVEEALEAARGIGMIPEAPTSTEDEYARELSELDRLLEEEEITKKGYDKRVLELKAKYGKGSV